MFIIIPLGDWELYLNSTLVKLLAANFLWYTWNKTQGSYSGSRTSGRVRCSEIMSLAYWLKAFFCQPSSNFFFSSGDNLSLSITTALPPSPKTKNKQVQHHHYTKNHNNIYLKESNYGIQIKVSLFLFLNH